MSDDIGHIYLAINSAMPGLVKIGLTKGDVQERMKELSADTGVPAPFKCAYFCKVQNPAAVEKQLHHEFAFCRESGNREFFRIDWRAVKAALRMMQADSKRVGEDLHDDITVSPFALVKYVKEGDADKVRQALAAPRCNSNQADENNQTALMWAAELGNAKIVGILMNGKANPNKADKAGRMALMLSAKNGHANIAKALLDYGANVNAADKEGKTALMLSAKNGHANIAKALLDYGANVNAADKAGNTALMEGVLSPKNGIDNLPPMYRFRHQLMHQVFLSPEFRVHDIALSAKNIIELSSQQSNSQYEFLNQPENAEFIESAALTDAFEELAKNGWLEKSKILESYRATEISPLYDAAKESAKTVVGVLLDGGATPSLHILAKAAMVGYVEIVRMLLDGGLKFSASDGIPDWVVNFVAKAGHADIVKILREIQEREIQERVRNAKLK